jgi:hypothetical protein
MLEKAFQQCKTRGAMNRTQTDAGLGTHSQGLSEVLSLLLEGMKTILEMKLWKWVQTNRQREIARMKDE